MKWIEFKKLVEDLGVNDETDVSIDVGMYLDTKKVDVYLDDDKNSAVIVDY